MKKIVPILSIILSCIFLFSACKQNNSPETTKPTSDDSPSMSEPIDNNASTTQLASDEQETGASHLEGDGASADPNIVNLDDNLTNTPSVATVSMDDPYMFYQDGVMMQYCAYGYDLGTMYQMTIAVLNDSGSDIVAEVENPDAHDKASVSVKDKSKETIRIKLFDINENASSVKFNLSWRKADEKDMSHKSTVTLNLDSFSSYTVEKYNKNGIVLDEIGARLDEKESVVYLMLLTSDKTCTITISNITYESAAGEKNAAAKEITINAEEGKRYTLPIVLYDKMIKNEIVGHISFDINDGTTTETYSEDIDTGIF